MPRDTKLPALTRRSGAYLGLRYGLGILVSFANMLVMTRWIGPHAYGVFVTALGLTTFLAALSRGGLDTYLVRLESAPDQQLYDIAATLMVGISVLLAGVGAAAVPLLTGWYGSHEFVSVYLVSLLAIPLAGVAGAPIAKLERELNFGAIAAIELGGQTLALVVSASLAWYHLGVWAPVTGLLIWQAWAAAGALAATNLRPRPAFSAREARAMLSFGLGYSASLRIWQLRGLVNPLIVGRVAGVEGVAYVGLAIRIAEGLGFVRAAAGRLTIAALSRLRVDRESLRVGYKRALTLQVLCLGPLLCLFAITAPFVVPRVLGIRWMPSLRIYPFVAGAVLVNSVYNLQAAALFVEGRQWVVLKAYAVHVGLLGLATFLLLPRLGLAGYGWAELVACGAYLILHSGMARILPISHRQLAVLVSAFLLPLFGMASSGRWALLLWAPLLAIAIRALWRLASSHIKTQRRPIVEPVVGSLVISEARPTGAI